MFADPREEDIGGETDDADDDDGREYVFVVAVFGLLVDKPTDARAGTNEFGNNEIGPCPAEQDTHVAIEVGYDAGNDDVGYNVFGIGTQGLCRFDEGAVELARGVANNKDHLEKCANENDGDFGCVVNAEKCDHEGTKCRCWHIADKVNKGFDNTREERKGAAENAKRNTEYSREHETVEYNLNTVEDAFMQPGFTSANRLSLKSSDEGFNNNVLRG